MNELCNSLHARLPPAVIFSLRLLHPPVSGCLQGSKNRLALFFLPQAHSWPPSASFCLYEHFKLLFVLLVLPGICQWIRQECQSKQDKINFPGWHRLLGIFSIHRHQINFCHIQMNPGDQLQAAACFLHQYDQLLSPSHAHIIFIMDSNICNTYLCFQTKQRKRI